MKCEECGMALSTDDGMNARLCRECLRSEPAESEPEPEKPTFQQSLNWAERLISTMTIFERKDIPR